MSASTLPSTKDGARRLHTPVYPRSIARLGAAPIYLEGRPKKRRIFRPDSLSIRRNDVRTTGHAADGAVVSILGKHGVSAEA